MPKCCVKLLSHSWQYAVGLREDESSIAGDDTDGFPRRARDARRVSVEYYSLWSYAEAHKTAGCSCLFGAKNARLLIDVAVMLWNFKTSIMGL